VKGVRKCDGRGGKIEPDGSVLRQDRHVRLARHSGRKNTFEVAGIKGSHGGDRLRRQSTGG